jgi:hypothetical protein
MQNTGGLLKQKNASGFRQTGGSARERFDQRLNRRIIADQKRCLLVLAL